MDTNRLRQFCAIVETGNLRRASELLGISHSGLSKSIKTLETELGYPLLRPSGRGIVVTDQGRALFEKSEKFFLELKNLIGAVEEKRFLRIGSFEVFTSYFMGTLVRDHLNQIDVEVHELLPGRLEEALLLNKIDLGITYEPVPRQGIEYVRVRTLEMGVYVRKGSFPHKDLSDIPFVTPVNPLEGVPSGVRGLDGWPDEKFNRKVRYRVDLMTTGIELTRQGLCAIFIPHFVAKLYNQGALADQRLEPVSLPKKMSTVKRHVYIVKRESTVEDSSIQKVAKALRALD